MAKLKPQLLLKVGTPICAVILFAFILLFICLGISNFETLQWTSVLIIMVVSCIYCCNLIVAILTPGEAIGIASLINYFVWAFCGFFGLVMMLVGFGNTSFYSKSLTQISITEAYQHPQVNAFTFIDGQFNIGIWGSSVDQYPNQGSTSMATLVVPIISTSSSNQTLFAFACQSHEIVSSTPIDAGLIRSTFSVPFGKIGYRTLAEPCFTAAGDLIGKYQVPVVSGFPIFEAYPWGDESRWKVFHTVAIVGGIVAGLSWVFFVGFYIFIYRRYLIHDLSEFEKLHQTENRTAFRESLYKLRIKLKNWVSPVLDVQHLQE